MACRLRPTRKGNAVHVRFQGRQGETTADLRIFRTEQRDDDANSLPPPGGITLDVHCEEGVARIDGNSDIMWQHAETQAVESLAADRPDVEVMLDHFCRRAVGGLIPVADLRDIYDSLNTLSAADDSLNRNEPVVIATSLEN